MTVSVRATWISGDGWGPDCFLNHQLADPTGAPNRVRVLSLARVSFSREAVARGVMSAVRRKRGVARLPNTAKADDLIHHLVDEHAEIRVEKE